MNKVYTARNGYRIESTYVYNRHGRIVVSDGYRTLTTLQFEWYQATEQHRTLDALVAMSGATEQLLGELGRVA